MDKHLCCFVWRNNSLVLVLHCLGFFFLVLFPRTLTLQPPQWNGEWGPQEEDKHLPEEVKVSFIYHSYDKT